MSVASEITRLQGVKSEIMDALSAKGVTVPQGAALADVPGLIGDIPGGGDGNRVWIGSTKYKYVQIGEQYWLAENFHEYIYNTSYPSHYYGGRPDLYGKLGYGILYPWYAICSGNEMMSSAMQSYLAGDAAGWRIPTQADVEKLTNFLGTNPGTKLKSTEGWYNDGNGTDDFGFNGQPSGYRWNEFNDVSKVCVFWLSTQIGTSDAREFGLSYDSSNLGAGWGTNKSYSFSVRLVKDV